MQGLGLPLDQALAGSYPALKQMFHSEDVKEGPLAFAEKRKPNWKGK
jgi:crotonobetainyl-CoA hydratase